MQLFGLPMLHPMCLVGCEGVSCLAVLLAVAFSLGLVQADFSRLLPGLQKDSGTLAHVHSLLQWHHERH